MRRHMRAIPTCALGVFIAAGALVLGPRVPAQELGLRAAADYSKQHQGLAVLVYQKGRLLFEEYTHGHKAAEAHHIFSGTKSFAPMVALVAQEEGLLSLDERVADTITEWKDDERRRRITIRQLLNFTSGLRINDAELHTNATDDKYAASIACKAISEPGTKFRYGSCHLMVFGALIERKLAKLKVEPGTDQRHPRDFVDYLRARILDPIGCKDSFWLRDATDNPMLPFGAFLTAREWAKFGHLVINRGRKGKRQIVPAEHFDECFQGTKANPTYGLNFWLRGKKLHARYPNIPKDTVAASGKYKQVLYIIPSRELVIVRFGKIHVKSKFSDAGFLKGLFQGSKLKNPDRSSTKKDRKRVF